jgi:HEPN domain-containing protein
MPPPERHPRGSPAAWITHAQGDLTYARLGQEHSELLNELACFHAQQAAEKALKAVLLQSGTDVPFVHDLEFLVRAVRLHGLMVPPELDRAKALTLYAAVFRYPDHVGEVNDDDVREAIEIAEVVLGWAVSTTYAASEPAAALEGAVQQEAGGGDDEQDRRVAEG